MSKSPEPAKDAKDMIPDEEERYEVPLTMQQSVLLENLPPDATKALGTAGELGVEKVQVRLHPIGSAPHLKQRVFNCNAKSSFAVVIRFLRRRLGLKESESVHCYVGNVFSPRPDEGVGGLWRCFKTGEELVVGYALAPAFG